MTLGLFSRLTLAHYKFSASLPRLDHLQKKFVWFLEICRDDANAIAGRTAQAGLDSRSLSEVPRQLHHVDGFRMLCGISSQNLEGAVSRAIFDKNKFKTIGREYAPEVEQFKYRLMKISFILIDRHDDQIGRAHV